MIKVNPTNQTPMSGHSFSRVPQAKIERSTFDRDRGYKTTMAAGYLYPVLMDEMLPGDTFKVKTSHVIQTQPLLTALKDNMYFDMHYWFVPLRLLWNNFQRMMGERDPDPDSSIDYTTPQITHVNASGQIDPKGIYGYMGIPPITPSVSLSHSALFLRAYNQIWNQWYRDQNLQDSATVNLGDGPDAVTDYTLLKKAKRHDQFTSALPWAQKGDAVSLPLGTSAPVDYIAGGATAGVLRVASDDSLSGTSALQALSAAGILARVSDNVNLFYDPNGTLEADLTSATAATINDIRLAIMTQELLERDARGGTRYTEIILSHFGVSSPDARLQRPEFLGGYSDMIRLDATPNLSGTGNQGALTSVGLYGGTKDGFSYSATEHGVVLGLASIRADLTYQQGLNRMWSRSGRYDYYLPILGHLGEVPILNKEIYAIGDDGTQDDATFGYQECWYEYRYSPSLVTGEMNSLYSSSLDTYHLAQEFGSLPTLGDTFIQENPPISRVMAVTSQDPFIVDLFHNVRCTRPIPLYSVPQISGLL